MRLLFLALAVLAAGRSGYTLYTKGVSGRPVALPLSLLVVVVLGYQECGYWNQNSTYSRVSQRLTGMKVVSVHCQRFSAAMLDIGLFAGYVKYDGNGVGRSASLSWETCKSIRAFQHGSKDDPPIDEVQAIHVLAHESQHLGGVTDEAEAECNSVNTTASTARLLGASDAQAASLAARYFTIVWPEMPDDYRLQGCQLTRLR